MGNLARAEKLAQAGPQPAGADPVVEVPKTNVATDGTSLPEVVIKIMTLPAMAGIDIRRLNVKHPNQDKYKDKFINFSCWDFAGQVLTKTMEAFMCHSSSQFSIYSRII